MKHGNDQTTINYDECVMRKFLTTTCTCWPCPSPADITPILGRQPLPFCPCESLHLQGKPPAIPQSRCHRETSSTWPHHCTPRENL